MYKNNNKTKYYIYNCVKEDYITTCDSFEELIEYIASFNYLPWWSSKKYCNRFLEDYNCTMNDTKVYCDWTDKAFKRTYVVFDNMFRIIDVRMYEKEILGYTPPKNRKRKWTVAKARRKRLVLNLEKDPFLTLVVVMADIIAILALSTKSVRTVIPNTKIL